MELRLQQHYHLILNPDELRLVCRGLRRVLHDDEAADALALQEMLMYTKHRIIEQQFKQSENHIANITAAIKDVNHIVNITAAIKDAS